MVSPAPKVTVSACGRPFLVHDVPRLASLCLGGLGSHERNGTSPLNRAARRALARHWSQIALMEHASVAAFARFTLELLALGAPADLLEASQRALGDEIAHARLCFDLASRYAGRRVSAGTLSLEGALDAAPTRRDIVRRAFLEACIGETQATAEAEAALLGACDPEVVAALTRIAADEARHAELGFRFVAWTLETAPPAERQSLRDELAALLDAQLAEQPPSLSSTVTAELGQHGLLPEYTLRNARRRALEDVVAPCAAALGITHRSCAA
ncbi:MAG: hypothetical protein QM756_39150 [Polyangiaceae bacterium]